MRAAEKPSCSTCRKTWALSGKEPDCSICIVPLMPNNQGTVSVYNTTIAIKNLGLEPIFDVMKMLGTKDKINTVAAAITLAAKFKEKRDLEQKMEKDLHG